MKKKLSIFFCSFLIFCALSTASATAKWIDFTDISGHWSESTMKTAYFNGLVKGTSSTTLSPNKYITRAELLTLLTRVLSATESSDISDWSIDTGLWYYRSAQQAAALNLLDASDASRLGIPIAREEAFRLMAEAFQLVPAEQSLSCLDGFYDANKIASSSRPAVAALVENGYVIGSGNMYINPASNISRAELITLVGRIIENYVLAEDIAGASPGNTLLPSRTQAPDAEDTGDDDSAEAPPVISPSVALSDLTLSHDLTVNCYATDVSLHNVSSSARILIRSGALNTLSMEGGYIERLILAQQSGDVDFAPAGGGSVGTFVVGTGGGAVSLSGDIADVEVTGSGRSLSLSGIGADALLISGSGNTVTIDDAGTISRLEITGGGNTVIIHGQVTDLSIFGKSNAVSGGGYAGSVFVTGVGNSVTLPHGQYEEDIAQGLEGVGITLTPSATTVAAGEKVTVQAAFTGVETDLICGAQWYKNGAPVSGFSNSAFPLSASKTSAYSPSTAYADNKSTKMTVGLELTYVYNGETQRVYQEVTITIDHGLDGVGITLTPSATTVAAGGKVTVQAAFTGVRADLVCAGQWYKDGVAVPGFGNSAFPLSASKTSAYSPPTSYASSTTMKIGLELTYVRSGVKQRVYKEVSIAVTVDRYSGMKWSESYALLQKASVVSNISATYSGNYTQSYNIDYSAAAKESFVNSHGYSSASKYLVWVNRGTQKCYIFTGSKGNWRLLYTFVVATGKSSTPTPSGVFRTTYKESGWYHSTYTVRPVVRFKGGGYAFHSRLYYPGSSSLTDARIGFPMSAGCIRMYATDINWMYNNLPNGSTVVVY